MREGLYVKLFPYPLEQKEANAFIEKHHRHSRKIVGDKFRCGIIDISGKLRGVVTVGRPISRSNQDGHTLEVTRNCTDGVRNGCSMLYGIAVRVAKELGYSRLITYTRIYEKGTSLRACGWKLDGITTPKSWNTPKRKRYCEGELVPKKRWVKILREKRERQQ